MTSQTIAVTGATGQQGGATARRLLASGWAVRAITRDPSSAAAHTLTAAGAEVVAADFADLASLAAALQGVHGLFIAQPSQRSAADELRQGRAVADAALDAGLAHVVYSSVGGAERDSGIPTFETKWAIEQHIAALELPATILRPVAFMENYPSFRLRDGALHTTVDPDFPEQLIATEDIGAFAALAFADPDQYVGRALEIAGDELTAAQAAEAIARATGSTVPVVHTAPGAVLEALGEHIGASLARTPTWLRDHGYEADIPRLRALHPELLDFDSWLARTGAAAARRALQTQAGS
jgi:uncharacterized protein YbjT (DUF2867 family)